MLPVVSLTVEERSREVFDGDAVSCKLQAFPAASLIETLQTTPTAVWSIPQCTRWQQQTTGIRPQTNPFGQTVFHFQLISSRSHGKFTWAFFHRHPLVEGGKHSQTCLSGNPPQVFKNLVCGSNGPEVTAAKIHV